MNKKTLLGILILGLLLIAGCRKANQANEHKNEVQPTGEIREFEIIAKNWDFIPNTIEVNLGDKVELHVESIEGTHGFRLSEFGINERLEPNQDVHIDFVADKRGAFTFACSISCGFGHGTMNGQLIVK